MKCWRLQEHPDRAVILLGKEKAPPNEEVVDELADPRPRGAGELDGEVDGIAFASKDVLVDRYADRLNFPFKQDLQRRALMSRIESEVQKTAIGFEPLLQELFHHERDGAVLSLLQP